MKDSPLLTRTIRGFAWSFIGSGGQALAGIVVVSFLARLLSPSDFGVIGAALVVVGLTQVVTQLGVGPALVQMRDLSREHQQTAFAISLIVGTGAGILVSLSARPIAAIFDIPNLEQVVPFIASVFPIASIGVVSRAMLQRRMLFRALALIEFCSYVFGYGVTGVVMALAGHGIWSLVAATIGQAAVSTVLVVVTYRELWVPIIHKKPARQLLRYGTGLSIANIANYFATEIDSVVIARFLGAPALGFYSRSYQFAMLPTKLIGSLLDKVMFPAMATLQSDETKLGRATTSALTGIALVCMPISAVLFVIAPELIAFILGPEWHESVGPFRVLIVVLAFRAGYKISDSLARARGAVYHYALRQWLYSGMVLVGTLLGQHFAGIVGVAIGVSAAVVSNYIVMLFLATQLARIDSRDIVLSLLRHGLLATILGALGFLVKAITQLHNFPNYISLFVVPLSIAIPWLTIWLYLPRILGQEGLISRVYLLKARRGKP